ncbi:MAG: PGF-pre-PGF domain-containing protein [Candidatus Nanoarchaeia archaeon]
MGKQCFLVLLFLVILATSVIGQGFAHSQLKNPPLNPQAGQMWQDIEQDTWTTLAIDDSRLALTEMNFRIGKNVSSAGVMIYKLLNIPAEVPPPPGRAYQYFKVDYSNLVYWDVKSATFKFDVDRAWLDKEQSSSSLISLFRLDSGSWEQVPTGTTGFDNATIHYAAEAEGSRFYVIAVAGSPSNPEDFQTLDSSTLFLQQIGSNEVYVIQEGEPTGIVGEEEVIPTSAEDIVAPKEPTIGIEKKTGVFKEPENKTPVEDKEEPEFQSYGWLLVLLLAILAGFLIFRWKTKPMIEKEVLDKIKKHK